MGVRKVDTSEEKEKLKDKKLGKAMNNIYKRNYSWLLLQINKLPLELKKEIKEFRTRHDKIRKENPANSIDTPHTSNSRLLAELDRLTERICTYMDINPEGLRNCLMFYILHERIKPPAANFYITEENGLVSVHYFRQPTKDDFYLESIFVKSRFKNRSVNQTIQYDQRLYKTILRKQTNALSKSTWDKIDDLDKEKKIKIDKDTQKRNSSKQDKHRFEKLLKELQ